MEKGFNPYFIGLPILMLQFLYRSLTLHCQFQSLFYWITYSYLEGFAVYGGGEMFQSLFYWITYSYYNEIKRRRTYQVLFQSLFYWITYSYLLYSFAYWYSLLVSILILLDYLFLLGSTPWITTPRTAVSILILLDYLFLYLILT